MHVAERVVEELNEGRELVQILRRVMEVHRVQEETLKPEGVIHMVAQVRRLLEAYLRSVLCICASVVTLSVCNNGLTKGKI